MGQRWSDEQVDGRVNGWRDGRKRGQRVTDGSLGVWTVDRWKAGWEMGNRCMGVWMGDGRMRGRMDGVCVCVDGWKDEPVGKRMDE